MSLKSLGTKRESDETESLEDFQGLKIEILIFKIGTMDEKVRIPRLNSGIRKVQTFWGNQSQICFKAKKKIKGCFKIRILR